MITFTIDKKPTPYCRTTQRQKYYSKQYSNYCNFKNYIQYCFLKEKKNIKIAKENYYKNFEIAISIYGKCRGDIDNVLKGVLDALNYIAYKDDKACISAKIKKVNNDLNYTTVCINYK